MLVLLVFLVAFGWYRLAAGSNYVKLAWISSDSVRCQSIELSRLTRKRRYSA